MPAFIRITLRFIRRNPLAVVLSNVLLLLGFVGASTSLTILQTTIRSQPGGFRLLRYGTIAESSGAGGLVPVPWTTFQQLQTAAPTASYELIAYSEPFVTELSVGGVKERVLVAGASSGLFRDLVPGFLGSNFSDVSTGTDEQVTILSTVLAGRLFGGDPVAALGHIIKLGGNRYRVIGIAPPGMSAPFEATDAWVPPRASVFLTMNLLPPSKANGRGNTTFPTGTFSWGKVPVFYVFSANDPFHQLLYRQRLERALNAEPLKLLSLRYSDGLTRDPKRDQRMVASFRLALVLSFFLLIATSANYSGLILANIPSVAREANFKRLLGASNRHILFENLCGPGITILGTFVISSIVACAVIISLRRGLLGSSGSYFRWSVLFQVLALELAVSVVLTLLTGVLPSSSLLSKQAHGRLSHTATQSLRHMRALSAIISLQIASCLIMTFVAETSFWEARAVEERPIGFNSNRLTAIEASIGANSNVDLRVSDHGQFPFASLAQAGLKEVKTKSRSVQAASVSSCAPFGMPLKSVRVKWLSSYAKNEQSVRLCSVSHDFFRRYRIQSALEGVSAMIHLPVYLVR